MHLIDDFECMHRHLDTYFSTYVLICSAGEKILRTALSQSLIIETY